jgi:hypothetical protein
MTLAIANATKANLEFQYREPVNNLVQTLRIYSGSQQVIGQKWTNEQKALVIQQLERYGARDAAEVYGKMGAFHGITYRNDAVISEDEIKLGHEAVVETQQERSVREATKAALGFDRAVRRPNEARRVGAKQTRVEVEQQIDPRSRATGNEVHFDLTVDPEGRKDVALPV